MRWMTSLARRSSRLISARISLISLKSGDVRVQYQFRRLGVRQDGAQGLVKLVRDRG